MLLVPNPWLNPKSKVALLPHLHTPPLGIDGHDSTSLENTLLSTYSTASIAIILVSATPSLVSLLTGPLAFIPED